MKAGALADYFDGVGTKVLMGTEIDPRVSHGHELQGISDFRAFLGSPPEKIRIPVTYVWLADDAEPFSILDKGTWYDSRRGQIHRDPEYRLYYPASVDDLVHRAAAGDRLFLCKPKDGPLLALFCPRQSSIEQQLLWLFDLKASDSSDISQIDFRQQRGRGLDLAARYILELINIEVVATEDQWLERMLREFKGVFPTTDRFSKLTRSLSNDVDPQTDPDAALVAWMDLEERLFMTLERHIVGERLKQGFLAVDKPDVDGFVKYSLGVQNRRKSRAGFAFANHIEQLLAANNICFKREATTEKRNGPDFLFPGEREYHDIVWPAARLTMLGAKTSCKDRWRQVLAEANRIERKHLLTLEPGISPAQTTEMKREKLQLVIPKAIQASFRDEQRPDLLNVAEFLELVRERQRDA